MAQDEEFEPFTMAVHPPEQLDDGRWKIRVTGRPGETFSKVFATLREADADWLRINEALSSIASRPSSVEGVGKAQRPCCYCGWLLDENDPDQFMVLRDGPEGGESKPCCRDGEACDMRVEAQETENLAGTPQPTKDP